MRHLLHRHEALDAEGFAAQLAGSTSRLAGWPTSMPYSRRP
ncbi:hypothetical protein K3Z80_19190, partial [Pseudomonas aeruginosa]|nr:hypothetical protein [Pseudomonas aeruginosa]